MTDADIQDSFANGAVLSVLLFGLQQLLEAGSYLVGEVAAARLTGSATVLGLASGIVLWVAIGLLVWRRVRTARQRSVESPPYDASGSYLREAFGNAAVAAGVVTYAVLVFLDNSAGGSALPPQFFIKVTLFVLCVSLSIAFLVQTAPWPRRSNAA